MTEEANSTGSGKGTASGRDTKGKFVPGNKFSPGRPKGSRIKLSEAFLSDAHKSWLRYGREALDKLAQTNPEVYVRVMATILPKVIEQDAKLVIEEHSELDLKIRDFREAWKIVGANPPPMIETQVIEEGDDGDA